MYRNNKQEQFISELYNLNVAITRNKKNLTQYKRNVEGAENYHDQYMKKIDNHAKVLLGMMKRFILDNTDLYDEAFIYMAENEFFYDHVISIKNKETKKAFKIAYLRCDGETEEKSYVYVPYDIYNPSTLAQEKRRNQQKQLRELHHEKDELVQRLAEINEKLGV